MILRTAASLYKCPPTLPTGQAAEAADVEVRWQVVAGAVVTTLADAAHGAEPLYLVAFVTVLLTNRRQRLGDLAAHTLVVASR